MHPVLFVSLFLSHFSTSCLSSQPKETTCTQALASESAPGETQRLEMEITATEDMNEHASIG